jgi:hypothetical protein
MGKANKTVTEKVAKGKGKAPKGKPEGKVKGMPKGKKKPAKVKTLAVPAAPVKLSRKALATDASKRTDTNGVVRQRASLFGRSVSSVWRWCGANGMTVADVKEVRDAAGLSGVITDGNVKCQTYDGQRVVNGLAPLYATGDNPVPTLSRKEGAELFKLAGLTAPKKMEYVDKGK